MCKGKDFPRDSNSRELTQLMGQLACNGEPAVVATVVSVEESGPTQLGSKLIVYGQGELRGTVGGGPSEAVVIREARLLMRTGGCRLIHVPVGPGAEACGSTMDVFLESIHQGFPFWVIGAGHVGRAILDLGRHLPFRFSLVDDLEDRLAPIRDEMGIWTLNLTPPELAAQMAVTSEAGVLIATRSHELDWEYLQAVLAAEKSQGQTFSYLGLLGSTRKVQQFKRKLGDDPHSLARLDQAQMPVGMELGDGSPYGIALSILSEAMAVLNHEDYLRDDTGGAIGLKLHRRRES